MRFASVLITGGAGFIGTHLARYLLETQIAGEVVSLDIADPEYPVRRVRYLKHDVRRPLDSAVRQSFDLVVNLAAVHRTPGHPDHAYYDTNVRGANNVVDYCDRHGIRTLLFTSSIAIYGPSEDPLDETCRPVPQVAYGRSKLMAEEMHISWKSRHPSNKLVIVRPAVVFGTGENGNFSRLGRTLRKGFFAYPGRSDTKKAGGYVKELVRTMMFALERADPLYIYNFANPTCPTAVEICDAFCEVTNAKAPLGTIPASLMLAAAGFFEVLDGLGMSNEINRKRVRKLLHSTYVVPQRLIDDGYQFAYTLESAIADWIAEDSSIGLSPRVEVPAVKSAVGTRHVSEAA